MKKLSLIIAALAFASSLFANETIARLSGPLCEYVKNDDRSNIRKKLRSASLQLRHTYRGFVCQPEGDFTGGSLLKTATYYGSTEVSSFLIKQISKGDIEMPEHDGKTTIQWAKEALTNGQLKDAGKAKSIYSEMEDRVGD